MAKREIESVPLSRFGVLVAQLESIVASTRQQPLDPLLCFDLLSDLVAALEDEPKESVAIWQRKCEDALYSLLILGARRPVRRMASTAMVTVIAKGDSISIYSRASTLQGFLADGKRSDPLSCAGAAQCLGELYRLFGRRIASGLLETTVIVGKLIKFHEDFVRLDALQMLENALEGSGSSGAPTAYSEAFRIIMRVSVSDKSFIVRLAAARCLKAFASIGGPGLGISELENSMIYCIKALEDPVSSVRDTYAEALGALLALAMNLDAQARQRGKNHPVPAKNLEDGLQKHLISPFIRASGFRAKDLRIGLTLAYVFFLQVVRLKYHLPDFELQKFAFEAMNMLQGNVSMDAHTLACVLYILRVGVSDQMTEPTQRSFLVLLGRKLESFDYSPPVGVATLRILSYLLTTLGEVPVEFKDILDNTVVAALSHSSLHVRVEAALTLRALAEVDPTCVGGLISYGVTTLHALRESTSIEKGNHLNLELNSLHGQATVLAALVSISPKFLLGYPTRLPKSVFEVSKKMLTEFSRNPVAATVEKEAGWLLLASLIASMPKEELEDQVFDVLLLWAGPFVGNAEIHIKQIQDLNSELRVLSAAIEALTAFIRSFVSSTMSPTNGGILLQPVLAYLSGALSYISDLGAKELPILKPSVDVFTIRTLMAYQSISDPMTYRSEHPQLIEICTTPFSNPARCEESSCLRFLLDKRDACLGPWIPGRDWFEDELRAFEGGTDGLMASVWVDELCSFPQLEPLSKMLVNQKLLCFATIFASQDNGGKLILLTKIDKCLKNGKKQPWHVASISNACVGLLAGLKAVLDLRHQSLGVEILSSIQAIFQGIMMDGEINPIHRRASSEGLGLLARLGSDIFTARMTRSLLGELSVATDPIYIGTIAFALGCIHRSAGGMALSSLVPATVSSISSLAKSSNAGLQLWSLHALLLTIEAAGLSYVSQVQATLFLAIDILLSEENGLVDLRQEIGRLINAIVAVLGPELSPGSTFYSRCKSVIAEISSCQEISTLLEYVRFTQQLVLFAPQAVSVHCHVQNLLPTISSRQPSLRYLAVSTLQHLIEKDPVAVVDEKIEESLFRTLDEETDSDIGSMVRATITQLLYTSCPSCPSRWLAIFHNMILAPSRNASSENDHENARSKGNATLYYGEDDENMISSSHGEGVQGSVPSIKITDPRRDKHLRYRTRVFAAECLSYLPTAVGTDPAHFDLSLARARSLNGQKTSHDWLVLHLQELVSLSYQISTGQFDGMQPIAVRLLCTIMDKFEMITDPELPGHLLLEQYQVQFVSAVRSAIDTSASPLLLEAGLQLVTKILTSSIICEDRVALGRMFSVILRPLDDIKDLYYPSFAEWVACKIKVRLLAAHASVKCYVYEFLMKQKSIPDEYLQLVPLFSNSSKILGNYWISILKDYTHICFGLHTKFSYRPFLDGIQSPVVVSKVQKCLDEVWHLILQATVLDAVPVKFQIDGSNNIVDDLPKNPFLSGFSMIGLELEEVQFLWGLALCTMFQGQQVEVGKKVKSIFVHAKMECTGSSMLQETHDWMSCEIALVVLESLSKEIFFRHGFLTFDICRELLQVLICTHHMADSCNSLIICLLSQIVHFCPDSFFEKEDFTAAAVELCLKHLFVTFQSNVATPQGYPKIKDLLSELTIVIETIARRANDKLNLWRLKLALMSICYEWFRGASTNLCLAKLIDILQNLAPSLRKCFRDEYQLGIDDNIHLETTLGAWACMLATLSQDCIMRIHNVEAKMGETSKILAKILAFCMEEAFALAELLHEIRDFGDAKDRQMLLFTIFKNSVKCIRDAFYDSNIQVQLLGLHVLKRIAQRDLADGSRSKLHSFSLFFAGELFGDIFLLIQHTLKEYISRESLVVTEECLRLLFLFHTLSQATACQGPITVLLLEALVMVFSISSKKHSQELNELNATIKKLVTHLVHLPSSAIHIKDAILSMSVARRQQFQDMIRASVTQDQMAMQIKPNVQAEPNPREDDQLPASNITVLSDDQHGIEEDNDDDWDAFQSVTVDGSSPSSGSNVEGIGSHNAPVGDNSKLQNDSHDQFTLVANNSATREDVEESTDRQPSKDDGIRQNTTPADDQKAYDPCYPAIEGSTEGNGEGIDDCVVGITRTFTEEEPNQEQGQEVYGEAEIQYEGDENGFDHRSEDELDISEDNPNQSDDQRPRPGSDSEVKGEGDEARSDKYPALVAPKDITEECSELCLQNEGLQNEGDGEVGIESGNHEHFDDAHSVLDSDNEIGESVAEDLI